MKAFTSIKQSKKLAEFLPIESADNHYWGNGYYNYICGLGNSVELKEKFEEKGLKYLPCWSLAALLELIPTSIDEYTDDFSQLELTKQSISYVYAMGNLRKGFLKDNLLDAAFEMVCWLKETGKI